jgi:hypothetical protein
MWLFGVCFYCSMSSHQQTYCLQSFCSTAGVYLDCHVVRLNLDVVALRCLSVCVSFYGKMLFVYSYGIFLSTVVV